MISTLKSTSNLHALKFRTIFAFNQSHPFDACLDYRAQMTLYRSHPLINIPYPTSIPRYEVLTTCKYTLL